MWGGYCQKLQMIVLLQLLILLPCAYAFGPINARAVHTRGAIALRASSSRGGDQSTLHTREAHTARQSRGSMGGSSGAYNRGAGGGEGPTHPSPTRPRGGGVFALAGLRPRSAGPLLRSRA